MDNESSEIHDALKIIFTKWYYVLDAISKQTVGNRPGRHELRKHKKRPKVFPLLHGSRHSSKNPKRLQDPQETILKALTINEKIKEHA